MTTYITFTNSLLSFSVFWLFSACFFFFLICSILPPPHPYPYYTPTLPCLYSCSIPPLYVPYPIPLPYSLPLPTISYPNPTHSLTASFADNIWTWFAHSFSVLFRGVMTYYWLNLEFGRKRLLYFCNFAIKFGVLLITITFENNNNATTIKGTTIFPRPRKEISLKTIFPVFQKKNCIEGIIIFYRTKPL